MKKTIEEDGWRKGRNQAVQRMSKEEVRSAIKSEEQKHSWSR